MQIIQNPHYPNEAGVDLEDVNQPSNDINENEEEFIKVTKNIYYEK